VTPKGIWKTIKHHLWRKDLHKEKKIHFNKC
jgi:hypothetical protein